MFSLHNRSNVHGGICTCVSYKFALIFPLIYTTALASQGNQPPRQGHRAKAVASPTPTPTPLPPPTVKIDNYRAAAARIIGAALTSDRAYSETRIPHGPHRPSSQRLKSLERAIEWAVAEMKRDGLDNVRAEKVMVPHWVRGEESLEMLTPLPRKLEDAWTGKQHRHSR